MAELRIDPVLEEVWYGDEWLGSIAYQNGGWHVLADSSRLYETAEEAAQAIFRAKHPGGGER